MPARLVVTLPPDVRGAAAEAFAAAAAARGAALLEIRTDLHPPDSIEPRPLAAILPLIVADRGPAIPARWHQAASWVDRPVGPRTDGVLEAAPLPARLLLSHHAAAPLDVREAVRTWEGVGAEDGVFVKHVEPAGSPRTWERLFETQAALEERFPGRVTVLATGDTALPLRCLLSRSNLLEYVATGDGWAAAAGQRLLADAVRDQRSGRAGPRRALLGHRIRRARSPLVHRQPFDRIDLPPDTNLGPLLDALLPFYDGLAVTSPFKEPVARLLGAAEPAANTLVRRGNRWYAANTDVAGALAALPALGGGALTALGDGGVTKALRVACRQMGHPLAVIRRADVTPTAISGAVVWTWPERVDPPPRLAFCAARVGVVAYGESGSRIARSIRERGGTPVFLGPRWFAAQARAQRLLWTPEREAKAGEGPREETT